MIVVRFEFIDVAIPHVQLSIAPVDQHLRRRKGHTDSFRLGNFGEDLEPGRHHLPTPFVRLQTRIVFELGGDVVHDSAGQYPNPSATVSLSKFPGPQTPTSPPVSIVDIFRSTVNFQVDNLATVATDSKRPTLAQSELAVVAARPNRAVGYLPKLRRPADC